MNGINGRARIGRPRPPYRVQMRGEMAYDLMSEADPPRRLARLTAVQGGLNTATMLAAGAEALAALKAILPLAQKAHEHKEFQEGCGSCQELRWSKSLLKYSKLTEGV